MKAVMPARSLYTGGIAILGPGHGEDGSEMAEILVLYYSRGGSVARLARQIASVDRKSTRLNSSHNSPSRMPSSA